MAWEIWFTPKQTFKVEITAQHSPLTSLNFAALKIKDAVADRFRDKGGVRPDVDTHWPDVRIYAHLTTDTVTLYIDTSGEPLFKRGWREDKGDAPLKETLAAAMIAASGWDARGAAVRPLLRQRHHRDRGGADRLQHRARPAAPLRLREAAAVPAACVEGDLGGSQGRATPAHGAGGSASGPSAPRPRKPRRSPPAMSRCAPYAA